MKEDAYKLYLVVQWNNASSPDHNDDIVYLIRTFSFENAASMFESTIRRIPGEENGHADLVVEIGIDTGNVKDSSWVMGPMYRYILTTSAYGKQWLWDADSKSWNPRVPGSE